MDWLQPVKAAVRPGSLHSEYKAQGCAWWKPGWPCGWSQEPMWAGLSWHHQCHFLNHPSTRSQGDTSARHCFSQPPSQRPALPEVFILSDSQTPSHVRTMCILQLKTMRLRELQKFVWNHRVPQRFHTRITVMLKPGLSHHHQHTHTHRVSS